MVKCSFLLVYFILVITDTFVVMMVGADAAYESSEPSQSPALSPLGSSKSGEVESPTTQWGKQQAHSPSKGSSVVDVAEAPAERSRKLGRQHHHSNDASVIGGGVILAGLLATVLFSVICYIRATRRNHGETKAYA